MAAASPGGHFNQESTRICFMILLRTSSQITNHPQTNLARMRTSCILLIAVALVAQYSGICNFIWVHVLLNLFHFVHSKCFDLFYIFRFWNLLLRYRDGEKGSWVWTWWLVYTSRLQNAARPPRSMRPCVVLSKLSERHWHWSCGRLCFGGMPVHLLYTTKIRIDRAEWLLENNSNVLVSMTIVTEWTAKYFAVHDCFNLYRLIILYMCCKRNCWSYNLGFKELFQILLCLVKIGVYKIQGT